MVVDERLSALEERVAYLEAQLSTGDRASVVDVALELARRRSLRPRPSDGPISSIRRQVVQWVALAIVGVLAATGAVLARSCVGDSIAPGPLPQVGSGAPP